MSFVEQATEPSPPIVSRSTALLLPVPATVIIVVVALGHRMLSDWAPDVRVATGVGAGVAVALWARGTAHPGRGVLVGVGVFAVLALGIAWLGLSDLRFSACLVVAVWVAAAAFMAATRGR